MKQKINKGVGYLLSFLMGFMVLAVLWQVFTRYILGSASSYTGELARFLLIWVGILGAAYAAGQNMHLAIELLPNKLEGKKKLMLNYLIKSLIILFVLLTFVIGGGKLVYIVFSLGQKSPTLQIPMSVVYLIIPLSGLLIIYYKITEFSDLKTEDISASATSQDKKQ